MHWALLLAMLEALSIRSGLRVPARGAGPGHCSASTGVCVMPGVPWARRTESDSSSSSAMTLWATCSDGGDSQLQAQSQPARVAY